MAGQAPLHQPRRRDNRLNEARLQDQDRCLGVGEGLSGQRGQVDEHDLRTVRQGLRRGCTSQAEGDYLAQQGIHDQREAHPVLRQDEGRRHHVAGRHGLAEHPPQSKGQERQEVLRDLHQDRGEPALRHSQPCREALRTPLEPPPESRESRRETGQRDEVLDDGGVPEVLRAGRRPT